MKRVTRRQTNQIIKKEFPKGIILGVLLVPIMIILNSIDGLKSFVTTTNAIGLLLLVSGISGALSGQTISINILTGKISAYQGPRVRIVASIFALLGLILLAFNTRFSNTSSKNEPYTIQASHFRPDEEQIVHSSFLPEPQTISGKSMYAPFDITLSSVDSHFHYKISDLTNSLCENTHLEGDLYKGRGNSIILVACDQSGKTTDFWTLKYIPRSEMAKLPF